MQEHRYSFEVDATRDEIWSVLHPRPRSGTRAPDEEARRVIEHGDVRIEIWNEGDDDGEGLVRTCHFRVPKWLLSGGRGRSWECVTVARPPEHSRYEAVGKPLWSKASGSHTLVDLGRGRTRIDFVETYHAFNPLTRVVFEKRVHAFISRDNDALTLSAIEDGVARLRAKRSRGTSDR